jgi:hypothetical protein
MEFGAPQIDILRVELDSLEHHILRVLARSAKASAKLRDALAAGHNALAIGAECHPLPLMLLQFRGGNACPILPIGIRRRYIHRRGSKYDGRVHSTPHFRLRRQIPLLENSCDAVAPAELASAERGLETNSRQSRSDLPARHRPGSSRRSGVWIRERDSQQQRGAFKHRSGDTRSPVAKCGVGAAALVAKQRSGGTSPAGGEKNPAGQGKSRHLALKRDVEI